MSRCDSLNDGAMLGDRRIHAAGLRQEEAADAVEMRAKQLEDLPGPPRRKALDEKAVEGHIDFHEAGEVTAIHGRLLIAQVATELVDGALREAACAFFGNHDLDRAACGHPLDHVIELDF